MRHSNQGPNDKISNHTKMKRVEINKETKKTNFKLKLKDESQKIREANFIQELEQDIKRVETEKKIKKYNYQTEKHASSLEEQKEMKTRGKSNPDNAGPYPGLGPSE